MASTEEKAYEIMRELDVSYVLVIFGGLTGYSSDGKSPRHPACPPPACCSPSVFCRHQ